MANNATLGTLYDLVGAQVTNGFTYSTKLIGGACAEARLIVKIITDSSSKMTAVDIKCQGIGTAAGTDYCDLISYKLDTNTNQPELDHSYSALSTGTIYYFAIKVADCSRFAGGVRVGVKGTFSVGTAGTGADEVTIYGEAW